MPYLVRLFSGDQPLVATGDHETPEEAGRWAGEATRYLLGEWTDDSGGASVRREVVYRDQNGERPATREEEDQVFTAMTQRMAKLGEAEVAPCPRCGRKRADHEQPLSPVRLTPDGPIYFACWTPEEGADLLSGR